ncbi:hypothetical protein [Dyella flagellata]|uniref:hypothetical protein n=1 Tax=Dyella flagellata TaxID=1867833 RepID=UPI0024E0DD93|nr:hypothetical protein [Dyella flagellata]
MSDVFDITHGAVSFNSKLIFLAGMTLHDVESSGVTFNREFDMKTGWVFRTARPYEMAGHTAHLSLGFEHDKLQTVAFAFADEVGDDLHALHEKHGRFVLKALGQLFEKKPRQTGWWQATASTPTWRCRAQLMRVAGSPCFGSGAGRGAAGTFPFG